MPKRIQRFGIKPWSRLIGELTQKLGVGLAWLDLRDTELQLQAKVVKSRGWRRAEVPGNQLCGFQGNLAALCVGNGVFMQAGAALKVWDVTDSVREGLKCPKPILKIKGCPPVRIKRPEQEPHAAPK